MDYRPDARIVRAMPRMTRRDFVQSASALLAAAGCARREEPNGRILERNEAMLEARPGNPTRLPTLGLEPLGLSRGRDGHIYVPLTYLTSGRASRE